MAEDSGRSNPIKGVVEGAKAVAKQAIGAVAGQEYLVREGKAQAAQASGYIPSAPGAQPPEIDEPTAPASAAATETRSGCTRASHRNGDAGGRTSDRARTAGRIPHHRAGRPPPRHRPLAEGRRARADAAAGPPPAREDHPLRPRAHPRAGGARPRRRRARRVPSATAPPRTICQAGVPAARASRRRCSSASPPCWARAARPTPCATPAASPPSSTPSEGTFDLVGNNIPVFFIQDGIKFPDVIHAGKPHPDREIPQAQSAHDTFWDFVSLHTEAHAPHACGTCPTAASRAPTGRWRASASTPSGWSTPTATTIAGEVPLEAASWACTRWSGRRRRSPPASTPTSTAATSPTRSRPGAYPQWELGVQVFPDTEDQMFEGIDLLDPTKIVPEELAPVQLDRHDDAQRATRPTTSPRPSRSPSTSATWCPASTSPTTRCCRRGCSPTSTPRSPGWAARTSRQLPINRPHAPVNDMLRDGFHQHAVHRGRGAVPARTPSTAAARSCAGADTGAFIEVPVPVPASAKVRASAGVASTTTSARRAVLPQHDARSSRTTSSRAYTFELGKCYEQAIKERAVAVLARHRRRTVRGRSPRDSASRRLSRLHRRWPQQPARRCRKWASGGRWRAAGSASSPTRTPTSVTSRQRSHRSPRRRSFRWCSPSTAAPCNTRAALCRSRGRISPGVRSRWTPS